MRSNSSFSESSAESSLRSFFLAAPNVNLVCFKASAFLLGAFFLPFKGESRPSLPDSDLSRDISSRSNASLSMLMSGLFSAFLALAFLALLASSTFFRSSASMTGRIRRPANGLKRQKEIHDDQTLNILDHIVLKSQVKRFD